MVAFDPPRSFATRGRIMPGTILDTEYRIDDSDGRSVLTVSKVAVGPMTDDEARGIRRFGDLTGFAEALRAVVEKPR